jgi:branched-chain amino acid transport system substrate-binding protein
MNCFRLLAAALLVCVSGAQCNAQSAHTPGVSASEIKIGQTLPLSGPVSAYATFGRASLAYFAMINERGGINGRKINLIIADDAFSPSKTVEQTRKLVESDEVFAIFAPMGSASSIAVQKYLNQQKVPQFLVQSGLPRWNNPKEFPWSISGYPNYDREALTYARFILETMPKARIAVLFQNDEFGRTYLSGLKRNLESKGEANVVAAEAFDITEPTVDSQVVNLAFSKADVLFIAATSRQTIQALKKAADLGWHPLIIVTSLASSVDRTYALAGLEISKGAVSATVFKDPADPDTAQDPDVRTYRAWMERYYPAGDWKDTLHVAAFVEGEIFTEVLKRCGNDVSRENFLKQATSLKGFRIPMIRNGIVIGTDNGNYDIFRSFQLIRFDGVGNRTVGAPRGD